MANIGVKTSANPAAGTEASITVPAGLVWVVKSVTITLVTSAVVGTRRVQLVADDGANIFARTADNTGQAASGTVAYSYFTGGNFTALGNGMTITAPLWDCPLSSGFRIRTITNGLDAGDDYGSMFLHVIELSANDKLSGWL